MFHPVTRDRRYLLWLLVIIAGILLYRLWVLERLDVTLYVDEAYYWGWAQAPAWGYFSKPPMIAWLIAATTAVFGDGLLGVKAGAFLVYPLTTLLVFAIGRRLFDVRVGFGSAVVFFTLPAVSLSDLVISTDVLLFFFWALALWAFIRALETDAWRHWLLGGLAGGLGLLTKYTMILFPLAALLVLAVTPAWRNRLREPRLYAAMGLALLVFLPNLAWNLRHGFPTFRHTADIANLDSAGYHWLWLGEFLAAQAAVFGPVLFAVLAGLAVRGPAWADPRRRLLLVFALVFLGVIALQALLGGANANWAAPAFVSASVLVVAALVERPRWLAVALGVNLALMATLYHYTDAMDAAGVELTADNDPYKRARGWQRLAEAARPLVRAHRGLPLMGEERAPLAHLQYHLRDLDVEPVAWNPQGALRHHYQLVADAGDVLAPGADVLFLTTRESVADVRRRFDAVERLAGLRVRVHEDWVYDYALYRLEGFRGY